MIPIFVFLIVFLLGIMLIVFFKSANTAQSIEKYTQEIFTLLFLGLIVLTTCFLLLSNTAEFALLFQQIHSIFYLFLFTVALMLLFTLTPSAILNAYAPWFLLGTGAVGGLAFYEALRATPPNAKISFERVKMFLVLLCFLVCFLLYYIVDPGGLVKQQFSTTGFLLTCLIGVFSFVYLLLLVAFPSNLPITKTNSKTDVKTDSNTDSNTNTKKSIFQQIYQWFPTFQKKNANVDAENGIELNVLQPRQSGGQNRYYNVQCDPRNKKYNKEFANRNKNCDPTLRPKEKVIPPKKTTIDLANIFGKSMFLYYGTVGMGIVLLFFIVMMRYYKLTTSQKNIEITLMAIVLFLWCCVMLVYQPTASTPASTPAAPVYNPIIQQNYAQVLLISRWLFGSILFVLAILWVLYQFKALDNTNINVFVLNVICIAFILYIIQRIFFINKISLKPQTSSITNTFVKDIKVIKPSHWLVLIAIVAFFAFFVYAYYYSSWHLNLNLQQGKVLLGNPISTTQATTLATYEELYNNDSEPDYRYAISCWVFLDSDGNNNSSEYKTIFTYGNKPTISYNSKSHTLQITMNYKDLKDLKNENRENEESGINEKSREKEFDKHGEYILYTNPDILLQTWNHIVLNYNGGTFDVFLNGQLVKSIDSIVPYFSYETMVAGEANGPNAGICNVVYYQQSLSQRMIDYLYWLCKHKNPPIP